MTALLEFTSYMFWKVIVLLEYTDYNFKTCICMADSQLYSLPISMRHYACMILSGTIM